jgi:hypothetical protein
MRLLRSLIPLLVLLAGACSPEAHDDAHQGHHEDGKGDGDEDPYDPTIPHIVPEEIYDFLQAHEMGDYHQIFHATRRWYVMSEQGREYYTGQGIGPADLQEGDPKSGLEFLAMHHAMIAMFHERFDALGHGAIFDGWSSDDKVLAAVTEKFGEGSPEVTRLRLAIDKLSDFDSFADDDAFGLYLQTNLRQVALRDGQPSDWRNYESVADESMGIHNVLHRWFADDTNPCNVGNPQVNLMHRQFWAIHGYIEWKWQQFRASYRARMGYAEGEDDPAYLEAMDRAGLHIQIHSHEELEGTPPAGENMFGDSEGPEAGE